MGDDVKPVCSKCGQPMEEGFVADRNYDRNEVSIWVAGRPDASFWSGARTGGQDKLPIRTFRCPKCGYLESYAGK